MHWGLHLCWASRFCALVMVTVLLCSCAARKQEPAIPVGPQVVLDESMDYFISHLSPANQELSSYKSLAPTIRKSLQYVESRPANALAINRPYLKVTWGELAKTLQKLLALLPELDGNPGLLAQNFKWVSIPGGISYTGYYEPQVRASRTRKPGYEQAIYARPPELSSVLKKRGKYYDRRTIEEKQVLAGRGLELAWAADPVDVFYMEIQGSGRLIFDDGTTAYVNFDGKNGHKYISSGRIMASKGLLKHGDIYEQREWFAKNPDRVREILNGNPSYVFFRYGGRGPTGAMGYVVDDWLSLATDRSFIPLGAIVAFGVNLPDETREFVPIRGIGFAQDVGGAIKRKRIDIFCGSDQRANYVASHLDAKGPAWILLAR